MRAATRCGAAGGGASAHLERGLVRPRAHRELEGRHGRERVLGRRDAHLAGDDHHLPEDHGGDRLVPVEGDGQLLVRVQLAAEEALV